ncbi:MAG TPA: hypothetical protein VFX25_04345 [Streptosporangiaceae bacterium]|nr:hypothetical protein [Streptosporangiaceae bacterium]
MRCRTWASWASRTSGAASGPARRTARGAVGHAIAAREAGAITAEEADGWISEQTRRAQDDRLLVALPMFLAAGTR